MNARTSHRILGIFAPPTTRQQDRHLYLPTAQPNPTMASSSSGSERASVISDEHAHHMLSPFVSMVRISLGGGPWVAGGGPHALHCMAVCTQAANRTILPPIQPKTHRACSSPPRLTRP
jgi:hypothetical protein